MNRTRRTTVKRVTAVAINTPQWTSCEPNKRGGQARCKCLALEARKDLRDTEV